jgi:citrate lyase subunit beta / citryl-CoA lyase
VTPRWPELVLPRSLLYTPGNRSDLVAKASSSAADAVVVDLEDSVPPADKALARDVVRRWLAEPSGGPQRWVRINAAVPDEDLASLQPHLPDGILLAGSRVAGLERLESWWTRESLPDRPVVGLVEDAAGLREIGAMAQAPHLATVGVGEVDLLANLRISRSAAAVIDALRLQVVVDAAAAGLLAPVAPTSTNFRDLDSFRTTTRALLDLGFRSRTAIHPAQVPVINEVLTPEAAEVEAARDVLARFEQAGGGVTTDRNGHLIDLAVVRGARETLARAGA